jgi:2,5-diamino-6-(ribosylamino)-4(3H)-pyrimidinone 5'-phosphate reductase
MANLPSISPKTEIFLSSFLPSAAKAKKDLPYLTLTYASSLDSNLALSPGIQTELSGPLTKSLTHYLRTHHDAILIGVSTAVADDPSLNSRLNSTPLLSQPRPIIVDPQFRWRLTPASRILTTARAGRGRAPFILISANAYNDNDERIHWVEEVGGKVLVLANPNERGRWQWDYILDYLHKLDVKSLMVEGGATVINELLQAKDLMLVDAVVVTIAPVYLGRGGVNVSPPRREEDKQEAAVRFKDVEWTVLGRDVVMVARPVVE